MSFFRNTLVLLALVPSPIFPIIYGTANPASNYGWLDQYSMDAKHHFVGNEACVPTSSSNGMTYLQNVAPNIFGTTLTGSSYTDWMATDDTLINIMGTTVAEGTYYNQFVYGLDYYIRYLKGHPNTQFSGLFPSDNWSPDTIYPKPTYIQTGTPTVEFLTNAIAAGSAVLVSIEYDNGGGHELLFNGIVWNTDTQTGLVYFIDPLDPSQNYSPEVPLGPAKQTVGKIQLSSDGKTIHLRYNQYDGRLPYTGEYDEITATLYGVLSVGAGPFLPFSNLLPEGNAKTIAAAFGKTDPTTAAMFPIMAVLNTTDGETLEAFFNQLDPSFFNAVSFNQQAVALRNQKALTNNFLQYRMCQGSYYDAPGLRLWAIPFSEHYKQTGHAYSYRAKFRGTIGGIDYAYSDQLMFGVGLSYAKSHLRASDLNATAKFRSNGVLAYAAWTNSPLWVDGSLGYYRSAISGKRTVTATSEIPIIAPISEVLRHNNHAHVYSGNIRASFDTYYRSLAYADAALWPYINLRYAGVDQLGFTQEGNPALAQHIRGATTHLLQPEIGLGLSVCFFTDTGYKPYLHSTLGYSRDFRIGGKDVRAYFASTHSSSYTISGMYPTIDLFVPMVMLGVKSPDDLFRLSLSYQGAFGPHYSSNELETEVSLAF